MGLVPSSRGRQRQGQHGCYEARGAGGRHGKQASPPRAGRWESLGHRQSPGHLQMSTEPGQEGDREGASHRVGPSGTWRLPEAITSVSPVVPTLAARPSVPKTSPWGLVPDALVDLPSTPHHQSQRSPHRGPHRPFGVPQFLCSWGGSLHPTPLATDPSVFLSSRLAQKPQSHPVPPPRNRSGKTTATQEQAGPGVLTQQDGSEGPNRGAGGSRWATSLTLELEGSSDSRTDASCLMRTERALKLFLPQISNRIPNILGSPFSSEN